MPAAASPHLIDSPYAWRRLVVTLLLMTMGSSGMYVIAVALPTVQAEFGTDRADASLAYGLLMVGFGLGGVLMGRLADRFGVAVPLVLGGVCLGAGYVLASMSGGIATFALVHGVLIGFLGAGVAFAPLIADTSLWFARRRGIAVGICASGNYLAGAVWPPIVQHGIATFGWRDTYFALGVFCTVGMVALAMLMRTRAPVAAMPAANAAARATPSDRPFRLTPGQAQAVLCVAGFACCVAMAMPQVHIVALCGDRGFGPARGAEVLAIMLAFGIASRLISGWICDRIGGLRTLLAGSALQGLALLAYLPADGLWSLYVVSAMFGLFQGGIVPSYAIIIREHFLPRDAGARVGTVIMFTMLGMAVGAWMSGRIFDITGSYDAAFVNGFAWNMLNFAIAAWLFWRAGGASGTWLRRRVPA
jgi:MFS family permease